MKNFCMRLPLLSLGFGLVGLVTLGCAGSPARPSETLQESYFSGLKGCFLLYNLKTGAYEQEFGEACRERFPACSTFKVPLAVMAFDAKILKDEHQVLKWDGKQDPRPELNRDHNAKTWMRDSVVWFSQRLTQKLGARKLRQYLRNFKYGNQDISAGLTEAWLVSPSEPGGLLISAYEQAEFLKELWTHRLPVSKRAMTLAREITFLEKTPKGFELSGKTGSNYYDAARKQRLGWFIAHLQSSQAEYIVVTTLSDLAPTAKEGYGGLAARKLTKRILNDLNLW